MRAMRAIIERMFAHPRGVLGNLGALLMAHTSDGVAQWVVALLAVRPDDHVLEVGFGPGVGITYAAAAVYEGFVAGIDASETMVQQASARNADAVRVGRVHLQRGSAVNLPYTDESFDKAMAMNSLHLWSDAGAGLRELYRVLRPGGTVAISFTPYSGQTGEGLVELLIDAGFRAARLEESEHGVCALGTT